MSFQHTKIAQQANRSENSDQVGIGLNAGPDSVRQTLRSPGQSLDARAQAWLGSHFSHDFSRVSAVHAGHSTGPLGRAGSGWPGRRYEGEANHMAAKAAASPSGAGAPGRPLDFSGVRLHTDEQAAESARLLNAKAYTFGNHIVFGQGRYQPHTAHGRGLLVHELTHHIQQDHAASSLARDPDSEWEKDMTGDRWNYYNTRAEAEDRRRALDPEGIRTRIDSGKIRGHTRYWVMIRRSDSSSEEPAQPTPDEPTQPAQPETESGGQGGASSIPAISLTFDDGPHSAALGTGNNRTENVLNTLRDNGGIKAGFFVQTGVSIRGASRVGAQLIQRMQREGHTVGTADHESHIAAARAGRLESELSSAKTRLTTLTGTTPGFVRPPFGASNRAVRAIYARLALTNLLWDIDGDDAAVLGRSPSVAALKRQVEQGLERLHRRGWRTTTASSNIVILYHDIRLSTSRHLGAIIAHIKRVFRRLTGSLPRFRAP